MAHVFGWHRGSGGDYPRSSVYVYPLDASQMSIILTGVYSWDVISEQYTV